MLWGKVVVVRSERKKGSKIYDWSQFDSFWILELLCRTNEIKTVKEYNVIDRI